MILRGIRFGGHLLCILESDRMGGLGVVYPARGWSIRCCDMVIVIQCATAKAVVDLGGLPYMEGIICPDVVFAVFQP